MPGAKGLFSAFLYMAIRRFAGSGAYPIANHLFYSGFKAKRMAQVLLDRTSEIEVVYSSVKYGIRNIGRVIESRCCGQGQEKRIV
jgi:hypothetical protein